jgi:hypothetical protein
MRLRRVRVTEGTGKTGRFLRTHRELIADVLKETSR